jgi:hypothetical protein
VDETYQEQQRNRMRYLDRLVSLQAQRGRHASKKANWLKFCRICGKDISTTARYQRLCEECR